MTEKPRRNWTEMFRRLWLIYSAAVVLFSALGMMASLSGYQYASEQWYHFYDMLPSYLMTAATFIAVPFVLFTALRWAVHGLRATNTKAGPSE